MIWGDVSLITLDESFAPVPGGEYLQGDFLARNRCGSSATLQVYAGAWQVSAGGSGILRAELGAEAGAPVTLTGSSQESDWGVLIDETAAPTNQVIPVKLFLGIPAAETMQSYSINPAWSLSLEAAEPTTVPDAPSGLQIQPASPTTEDRVIVRGTAEPGSTVDVTVDGQVRCTTTATPEGTFSCDVGTLSRGNHQISATATNSVGTSGPAQALPVTVRGTGPTGWGSLDDLLNWGSLGGLGSLGSLGGSGSLGSSGSGDGSGVGSEAGSTTGSIAAGSLGTLGSAAASSGASASGAGGGATGDRDGNDGTGATGAPGASTPGAAAQGSGTGQNSGTGAATAPGSGQGGSGGSGNVSGSPAGAGAGAGQGQSGGGQGTAPGTGGTAGTAGAGDREQSGTTGGTGGGTDGTGGGAAGNGQGAGTGEATGGQTTGGAGTGQLPEGSLGMGSSAPGQSVSRPLGSVDGLIQLGSSTIRVGS